MVVVGGYKLWRIFGGYFMKMSVTTIFRYKSILNNIIIQNDKVKVEVSRIRILFLEMVKC